MAKRCKYYKNASTNTIEKIKEVAMIVNTYTIDGYLSKQLQDIYKERIKDNFHISKRTFLRYIVFSREYLGYEFKVKKYDK